MKFAGTIVALTLAVLMFAPPPRRPPDPDAGVPGQSKVKKTKPRIKILSQTQLSVITSGKVKAKVWVPSPKKSSLKKLSKKAAKKARKAKQTVKLSLSVKQSLAAPRTSSRSG